MDRLVFLPHPGRKYEGMQVQNIIHPLNDSPALLRFIKLNEESFKETNKGQLANQDHFFLTPKILRIRNEMEELRMEVFRPLADLFGTPTAEGV